MQRTNFTAAALTALLSSAALAQTGQPQGDKPAPRAQQPELHAQAPSSALFCHQASKVLGAKVHSPQRSEMGAIEDLVIDPTTGQIDYAVLSLKERTDGQWTAVPFSALSVPTPTTAGLPQSGQPAGERAFVLDIELERLKNAPAFRRDLWPDMTTADWRIQLERHYEGAPVGDPVQRGDVIGEYRAVRASKLMKQAVHNAEGESIGSIEELALDPAHARVSYVVVSSGGFLGLGNQMRALPWATLQEMSGGERAESKLVANVTKERLASAPEYKPGEWPRMAEPVWMNELYTHYGVPPYWTHARMGARPTEARSPGAARPVERSRQGEERDGSVPR
jgi:sporulation protein YlmC with PRC-barrel domain